jgi:hypothetical protein
VHTWFAQTLVEHDVGAGAQGLASDGSQLAPSGCCEGTEASGDSPEVEQAVRATAARIARAKRIAAGR